MIFRNHEISANIYHINQHAVLMIFQNHEICYVSFYPKNM